MRAYAYLGLYDVLHSTYTITMTVHELSKRDEKSDYPLTIK